MAGGDLLRALTHELRNCIAPIVNAVHLIRLRNGADPDLAGMLAVIDRQVAEMRVALDTVVDADRLFRGEIALQRQRIDLATVIGEALESKGAFVERRRQHLHLDLGQRAVWIDADRERIVRVLANVLDNAVRHTPEGGDISVAVEVGTTDVEIRMSNNGRGPPAEELTGALGALSMQHAPCDGLGLGLMTARRLCELHGGGITARSEGDGKASTFVITVPLAVPEGGHPQSSLPTAGELGYEATATHRSLGFRVLVADDSEAARTSFAAILHELGHDVKLAADGAQALELAEQWAPEFVILDVHMPKVDGYAIARKLRTRFTPDEMRLIMMSGTDLDPVTLAGAKQAGFDHCIDKTLAVKGLTALLRGDKPSLNG